VVAFLIFNLPQYRGDRLGAAVIMLLMFGLASLPLTYFLSSFFEVNPTLLYSHSQVFCFGTCVNSPVLMSLMFGLASLPLTSYLPFLEGKIQPCWVPPPGLIILECACAPLHV
jgi:hypothetical protein